MEDLLTKKNRQRGLVIRSQSGFYAVEIEPGLVTCRLRGRLKRGPRTGDILAVGDRVQISVQPDGSGMIEEIEERERMFSRMAPTPRGEYQQIIIANPDQVILVFACAEPAPRLRMLDRISGELEPFEASDNPLNHGALYRKLCGVAAANVLVTGLGGAGAGTSVGAGCDFLPPPKKLILGS